MNASESNIESEQELRILFESIDEVFFSIDIINNKVIQVSKACSKVYGYPPQEFYKNADLFLEVIHPDDRERINDLNKTFTSGDFVFMEYRIIRSNNEIIWVQSKIKPTLDNDILVRLDGVVSNINERKNVEFRLESKIKELNLYIYRTTHDLRGPILSALGLVYIAKKETDDEMLLDYLEKIEESNKKLDSILLNLVDVIRSLNEAPVTKESINFETLVNEILKGFEHNPKRSGINIKLEINTKVEFLSDKKLITSMLFNLIQNSINYHSKNEDAYILIEVSSSATILNIRIKDNGLGIADEIQSKVFDMFYRGNEDSKGSGLGLYIVKNAVEKLEGKLELKSALGEGTTISMSIPIK